MPCKSILLASINEEESINDMRFDHRKNKAMLEYILTTAIQLISMGSLAKACRLTENLFSVWESLKWPFSTLIIMQLQLLNVENA